MAQSWLRTHPLRWLDRFLKFAIIPFANAEDIKIYATRGYYLLGILATLGVLASLPVMSGAFAQLPFRAQQNLRWFFLKIDISNEMWLIPLVLLFIYVVIFLIKPARYFFGELTANVFFGTFDVGIRVGAWCLQHRWWSLVIVIVLTSFISGGVYSLIAKKRYDDELEKQSAQRKLKLKVEFNAWLKRADHFVEAVRVTENQGKDYRETVDTFWEDYSSALKLEGSDNPHPGLVLRTMLHELYGKPPDRPWLEFVKDKLEQLKSYMSQYTPREGNMEPEEKQSWALMNIFMGRVYSHLGDKSAEVKEPPEKKRIWLAEAKEYFSRIKEHYEQRFQVSAHNGLGTVYAEVLTPPLKSDAIQQQLVLAICGPDAQAETCAKLALAEYAQAEVKSDECSYAARRKENNETDLLARLGMNYKELNLDLIDLSKLCGSDYKLKQGLANCIETHVNKLMKCAAHQPLWLPLLTATQAYATTVDLRKEESPADARASAAAAGRYLRLAYSLDSKVQENINEMKAWTLCYFRFANSNDEIAKAFWDALELTEARVPMADKDKTGQGVIPLLDPMPVPNGQTLRTLIEKEATQCPKLP